MRWKLRAAAGRAAAVAFVAVGLAATGTCGADTSGALRALSASPAGDISHSQTTRTQPSAALPSSAGAFVKWARGALRPLDGVAPSSQWRDLDALGQIVGDASLVAVGESIHTAAEPLEFRNRALQYLVREKGFTAIAIESGIVEARRVHDYVLGGAGDASTVLAEGFSWTFGKFPQNRALIAWLREYNANPAHARKVNFYGFDVPGSPQITLSRRGVEVALIETLRYLDRVDRTAAGAAHARFDDTVKRLGNYANFTRAERDALTAAIGDLVAQLEASEARYRAAGGDKEYEWGYRAAVGARQIDSHLRQTLEYKSELNVRDRAQADNLDWIVKREGASGKILIFAHNGHLSMASVRFESRPIGGGEASSTVPPEPQPVMGSYVRERYGKRLVTIGNLARAGDIGCPGTEQTSVAHLKFMAPLPQSIDALAAAAVDGAAAGTGRGRSNDGGSPAPGAQPVFLLDLRSAPANVASWLEAEHPFGPGFEFLDKIVIYPRYPVRKAFDAVVYIDTLSPACP